MLETTFFINAILLGEERPKVDHEQYLKTKKIRWSSQGPFMSIERNQALNDSYVLYRPITLEVIETSVRCSDFINFLNNTMSAPMYVGDGDGDENEGDWGSTGGFHAGTMGALWSPCANIAIILIIYSYRKYWVWLHMLFFFVATVITLVSSIPILAYTGIIDGNSGIVYDDYSASILYAHYIIGIVCLCLITIVSMGGGVTKLLNICNASSNSILLWRRLHTWSGYVTVIICKVNIYILGHDIGTWIAIDAVSVVIYVAWRYFFPKLQAREISPKYQEAIASVKSVNQLDKSLEYIVFANNIYDIQPLRYNHPAGYQICEVLKNKEVDRYIYGSCVADELPDVRMWSHSYRSFTLMDTPVARLDITPTFEGLDAPEVECNIPKLQVISQKGNIFQINLTKKEGTPFTFLKYRDTTQLGRYFGVTLNDKTTRLYTTVNFLVEENTHFLEAHLKLYKNWLEQRKGTQPEEVMSPMKENTSDMVAQSAEKIQINNRLPPIQMKKMKKMQNEEIIFQNAIPILFKVYAGGMFTEGIQKGPVQKILISQSKGQGLQLTHTKPGKIILVAGGTGIYPFSDFIDLLYKEQLMIHNPAAKADILNISPILNTEPFKNFTFEMLAAFQHIEDMHIITFEQLLYLAEKGRLKLTLKFREDPHGRVQEGGNISFTKQGFQNILQEKMSKGDVSRVWICGPPGMNIMVSKFLRQKYQDPSLYLIV